MGLLIETAQNIPPPAAVATLSPAQAEAKRGIKSSEEFTITIDKSDGAKLGVDVDHQDGKTLLIDAVTGGLVATWNAANPEKAVKTRDRIVEVNGIRGEVLQLVEECKKNIVLQMVVQRGES